MIDINPAKPSIPSIRLKELIINTPMNRAKENPNQNGKILIPKKPCKLITNRSLKSITKDSAISWYIIF